MTLALHHFFILTAPGAPAADRLVEAGLTEGTSNHHPGQGTANRRFFFANTALELLYVHDEDEARSGRAAGLRLTERTTSTGASPFGLVVQTLRDPIDLPFPGWRYCPEYFGPDTCFHVGANSERLEEPLCICMPPAMPAAPPADTPSNAALAVTELRLSVPVARPSAVLRTVAGCDGLSLRPDRPHRLEIVFNHAREGRSADLAPDLPLRLRW